jgi:hypothetical protein
MGEKMNATKHRMSNQNRAAAICWNPATVKRHLDNEDRLKELNDDLVKALDRLLFDWEEAIGRDPDWMPMADYARVALAKAKGEKHET